MKLWSVGYSTDHLDNFPQVVYKNKIITIEQEAQLVDKVFQIMLLTHRDAHRLIAEIKDNRRQLPYRDLYELVYPPIELEFQVQYFVELLNLLEIEMVDHK